MLCLSFSLWLIGRLRVEDGHLGKTADDRVVGDDDTQWPYKSVTKFSPNESHPLSQ